MILVWDIDGKWEDNLNIWNLLKICGVLGHNMLNPIFLHTRRNHRIPDMDRILRDKINCLQKGFNIPINDSPTV